MVSGDVPGEAGGFIVGFAAGSRIAGYRLEEQIGKGGMAVVFRARDEQLGRLVALKILARRWREIISPVASALDAAHGAGLLHRDVKPSNMLMDVLPGRPDHVYLSDFGLSKAAASTSGMTRAGEVIGTLDYMSPEQIGGKPLEGRVDQYALACSAFELLTGAPPFRRDEPMAVMYAQLSESPPALASRRSAFLRRSTASCRGPWPRHRATGTPAAGSSQYRRLQGFAQLLRVPS
jgi:serine/threonine protein kinase